MRRRTRLALLAAVIVAAAGSASVQLTRERTLPEPVSPSEAKAAAEASCREVASFEQLVAANADIDRVKDALRAAEGDAERAARGDPVFLGLAGGVQSLRVALDADDARAARVGIDVVRAECRRLSG